MTTTEEQAEARLNQLSDAMQLAVCDEECQAANAMTSLIVIISIVAICTFFCIINIWLIWIGKTPFCCCCSCTFGGLFPLKSRVNHYKKTRNKDDREDDDTETGLVESKSLSPFADVRMTVGSGRDG
jgi:hypothetical protein